jgi:hypothetical protein
MSGASSDQVKSWALEANDWLWGMAEGAFNEKQTTSQIVVDAVIGIIPLVGDVTAVRDLIAVSTRMAENPQKREEVMEWALLVILLFALIPVVGGVIKGVGRLLLKAGKTAAENHVAIKEIVTFLNRVGHGNAIQFIKQLDLLKYQSQLIAKFEAFCDKIIEAMRAMQNKIGGMLSQSMKEAMVLWEKRFTALRAQGSKMIPLAFKELNERLKAVQQAIYNGEYHTVMPGVKNMTREAEARLVEDAASLPKSARNGFKANTIADYHHKDGWPDLARIGTKNKYNEIIKHEAIEAFSGAMSAIELKPGQTIFRILLPKGNYKASPWWMESMPSTPEEWRTFLAVLDKFNANNFVIKYTIPHGTTLKAWKGKAAEQANGAVGQYLPGGGNQLYVQIPENIKAEIMKLPAFSTGWGRTLKLFGYEDSNRAKLAARTERLGSNEIQPKRSTEKVD